MENMNKEVIRIKSFSNQQIEYEVVHNLVKHKWTCSCPHQFFRKVECKHIRLAKQIKRIKNAGK